MENNIYFDKVFLTSGCSYTIRLQYLQSKLIHDSVNVETDLMKIKTILPHFGLSSGSIKHLKNVVITSVEYFLKNGIKSENIYIVGNLTQIGRKTYKFNKYEHNSILELLSKIKDSPHTPSIVDYRFQPYPFGFCELDRDIYSSLVSEITLYDSLPTDIKKRILTFLNYHKNLSLDELVEDYFNDLLILQNFLKKHKIEYTLFFMNNILEGWNSEYTNHTYSNWRGKFETPDLNKTFNIKNINTQVNSLYNLIDFDNIVLYSTEKQTFGGIDEFAVDNFKPTDFAGREDMEIKEEYDSLYSCFNHHPLENVQLEFEKKFIYPRMENFIKRNYGNQEN